MGKEEGGTAGGCGTAQLRAPQALGQGSDNGELANRGWFTAHARQGTENALGEGSKQWVPVLAGGQINCGVPARRAGGAGHVDQSKHGGLGRGTQAAEEQDRRLTAGKWPRD